MLASLFALAGLCALVLASPEQFKSANPSLSSVLAQIASLESKLLPPDSILTELLGIPSSVTAILGNPTAVSALEYQINQESGFPAWWSTLAPDAQSWVISIAGVAATIIPELVSLEIGAGLTPSGGGTGTAPATTSAMTTSSSNSTMITTSKATTTSVATTQASSSAAPSSSSKAGAAPTGVIAAGVLGAVGFLGVVVAL